MEDPNNFGIDEFIALRRKVGCESYICTNAGTGTAEEMSDWLEYCNLESDGEFARMRIAHGAHASPAGSDFAAKTIWEEIRSNLRRASHGI